MHDTFYDTSTMASLMQTFFSHGYSSSINTNIIFQYDVAHVRMGIVLMQLIYDTSQYMILIYDIIVSYISIMHMILL
jgi:hypothetical protein